MNRGLFRLSLACLAMFALLLLNINYVQGFESSSLASKPGNIRTFNQQFTYQRGSIIAAGGGADTAIAESVPVKGSDQYQRTYPAGPVYAPVTGYDSIYGATAIEQAYNADLAGTAPGLAVHNVISLVTGKPKQGANVYLTISPQAQQAAYQALQAESGHEAAAVAIDPSTGAILAMASIPSYDPNLLTSHDGAVLNKNDQQLLHDPAQPLLNRAINETFPPGSSFKIITSAAAFTSGTLADQNATVSAPQPLTLPNGHQLNNDAGELCGDGNPPVIQAFWLSCNTAFGGIGLHLGGPALKSEAEKFGVGQQNLTVPMPVSQSVAWPPTDAELNDKSLPALTAIGQLDDAFTPMQEAMDAAAIANHGTLMRPYLLKSVQAPDLQTVQTTQPSVLSQVVSSQIAGEITQMMIQVTQNPAGTAYAKAGPPAVGTGLVIAGKTGTAESGASVTDDAVFTCFAPASNPKIAVGVMVKGGGFGADAAAPIAVKIIQAYLGAHQ